MTAAPAPSYSTWDELVQTWQHLDLPNKAWRAEIIEESIVMSPPPAPAHNMIADVVHRELVGALPRELGIFQTLGIAVPLRRSLFIPDVVVVPRAEIPGREDPQPVPAERALLVVEITSKSNADVDRKQKLWTYAHAEVPLYVLIDEFAEEGPTVFLHSDPQDGSYGKREQVSFGKPIELPEPFGLAIPTDEF
ncbi:Uma2 family endonuclease [Saccharopolyspora sp. ID03-671]|uniref:Uma2 family endonuclease n=1 Tax=Saccharopolyspora sp. ID03-671 TaxID=3073066 RepID=UPI00325195DB